MLNNERGSIVLSMFVMIVIVGMGIALAGRAINNTQVTTAVETNSKLYYLAEAGLEEGLWRLLGDNDRKIDWEDEEGMMYKSDDYEEFGEGQYSIAIERDEGNIHITSTAEINGREKELLRVLSSDGGGGNSGIVISNTDKFYRREGWNIGDTGEKTEYQFPSGINPSAPADDEDFSGYHFDGDSTSGEMAESIDISHRDMKGFHTLGTGDVTLDHRYYFFDGDGNFNLDGIDELRGKSEGEPSIIFSPHTLEINEHIDIYDVYFIIFDGTQIKSPFKAENVMINSASNIDMLFDTSEDEFDFQGVITTPTGNISMGFSDNSNVNIRSDNRIFEDDRFPRDLNLFSDGSTSTESGPYIEAVETAVVDGGDTGSGGSFRIESQH